MASIMNLPKVPDFPWFPFPVDPTGAWFPASRHSEWPHSEVSICVIRAILWANSPTHRMAKYPERPIVPQGNKRITP